MRLLINLTSDKHVPKEYFNKYYFQSSIYFNLINTNFENLHNKKGFKFFTFSDFFPSGDLEPNKIKSIIISSPNKDFIKTLFDKMNDNGLIYLSEKKLNISSLKVYEIKNVPKIFETGSPIVLQVEKKYNKYFSFKNNNSISCFLRRLKENAIKKYTTYYNIEEFNFEEFIFDELMFKREVVVNLKKNGKNFLMIGSTWYYLKKIRISNDLLNFYRFIMEAGLGEKNSLGFGFINPKKIKDKRIT
ncbi:MAG: CRISPR-associated endoribonuclease Cas6 [Thermoplasmata archaeon]